LCACAHVQYMAKRQRGHALQATKLLRRHTQAVCAQASCISFVYWGGQHHILNTHTTINTHASRRRGFAPLFFYSCVWCAAFCHIFRQQNNPKANTNKRMTTTAAVGSGQIMMVAKATRHLLPVWPEPCEANELFPSFTAGGVPPWPTTLCSPTMTTTCLDCGSQCTCKQ
jgi:hypothetical protein